MSKVLGIGTDLLQVSRILNLIQKNGVQSTVITRFAERILHPEKELPIFRSYQQEEQTHEITKLLSGRWCVKESIYKSLSSVEQKKFHMNHWYKFNTIEGIPKIKNDEYFKLYPQEEFLITLSHDSDFVTSTVLRQLQ